jgi:hypothetical protein
MSGELATLAKDPRDEDEVPTGEISAFARNVLSLLERTEYRRCETGEDLEDICRLRYKAYRHVDFTAPNASGMLSDEMDEKPNCYPFGIYIDGHLVSTIRVQNVSSKTPWSPALSVYPDILEPMLEAGDTYIDPSRLAADPDWARIFPQIPYITLRLAVMGCFHFNAPYCVSMIRKDHIAFYRRVYRSRLIGEPRPYAGVINYYANLYIADVLAIYKDTYRRFPFFKSTKMEQRLMFGRPKRGEPAPLTVLPTAKYLREAA